MRLSAPAEYAIRILTYMSKDIERYYSAKFLHQKLGLPYKFTTKILTRLTASGFLNMKRGRLGGFTIAQDIRKVSVYDILEAIEGTSDFERCILGFSECSDKKPCAIHHIWKPQNNNLIKCLRAVSLEELSSSRAIKF